MKYPHSTFNRYGGDIVLSYSVHQLPTEDILPQDILSPTDLHWFTLNKVGCICVSVYLCPSVPICGTYILPLIFTDLHWIKWDVSVYLCICVHPCLSVGHIFSHWLHWSTLNRGYMYRVSVSIRAYRWDIYSPTDYTDRHWTEDICILFPCPSVPISRSPIPCQRQCFDADAIGRCRSGTK